MTPAINLLVPERFDVAAKTLYGWFRDRELDSDWGQWVYAQHLKVWNGFHEREPKKNGFLKYKIAFDDILDSMKSGRFDFSRDPIQVSPTAQPLNGAHRLAGAIIYGLSIPHEGIVLRARERAPYFTYAYFAEKTNIVPTGLATNVLDAMALEYCRLRYSHKDLYIVIIFPSAPGKDRNIKKIVEKYGSIIYYKEIIFSDVGSVNFVYQIYSSEPWVGTPSDNFKGAQHKAARCFAHRRPARIYLVQASSPDHMLAAKTEIRNLFQIKNNSVHINDTFEETLHLGRLLFNENSVRFLNIAKLNTSFPKFWRLLEECTKAVKEQGIDPVEFCIGGSGPMAAYGIRDVRDFDYVPGHHFFQERLGENITSHKDWMHYYHLPADDIVYNPTNHFYFHGIKFSTLNVVREMKIKRWERKDKRDVALINQFEINSRLDDMQTTEPRSTPKTTFSMRKLIKRFR